MFQIFIGIRFRRMKHVGGDHRPKRGQIRTERILNFFRQNGFYITDIYNNRENEIDINMKGILSKGRKLFYSVRAAGMPAEYLLH